MTTVQVLQDSQRFKLDESDDELFYSEPRFVHHLDASFRQRLTAIYRERIPPCAVVLDLMSSWVSHLPDDIVYQEVIGHGLNKDELTANPRLDRYWVQNLNTSQSLPLSDECIDATLIVAGWQYLQQPESVASELLRVTRPHGTIIVAFSNRMFAQKAPQIWFVQLHNFLFDRDTYIWSGFHCSLVNHESPSTQVCRRANTERIVNVARTHGGTQ